MSPRDLSVTIGSLTMPNPLIAASGCFGYGVEYADIVDLSSLGGVAVKGDNVIDDSLGGFQRSAPFRPSHIADAADCCRGVIIQDNCHNHE